MTTGQLMRKRRKELDLTADYVATAIGVSRSTIFRYENGEIEKVPVDILKPLAAVLETTPAYLMGWEEDPHNYDNDGELIADLDPKLIERFDGDVKRAYLAQLEIDEEANEEFSKNKNEDSWRVSFIPRRPTFQSLDRGPIESALAGLGKTSDEEEDDIVDFINYVKSKREKKQ